MNNGICGLTPRDEVQIEKEGVPNRDLCALVAMSWPLMRYLADKSLRNDGCSEGIRLRKRRKNEQHERRGDRDE